MENFVVSARKYRPQTFDTVVGQSSITQTLKNAIRSRQVAQAFLFCGPRGVGKTTCARILAKTINCENLSPSIEACDKCSSCVSFNENASFNIYELDGASNNSVDEIRNLVDKIRIPPQMGEYKVYIIDEVHMLSAAAFNAFLKTLEEPPPYAKFILATTEKHKIIPTILSRCQIFDFKRITVDDIVKHLQFVAGNEKITADESALHIIAQKADGAMRDALSIFDQLVSFAGNKITYETVLENLNVLDYEYFFKITEQILQGDISSTLLTINDILDKGFDGQHFLIGFGEHLRNLLVSKDPVTIKLLETAPSIRNRYLQQAVQCPVDFLLKALDINNKCDLNYKVSNSKRLLVELSLMQLCMLSKPATNEVMPKSEHKHSSPATSATPKKEQVKAEPATQKNSDSTPGKETKKLPGTFSIKESKETQALESAVNYELTDEEKALRPADMFTIPQMEKVWDEYSETLETEIPYLFTALKNRRPILRENFLIEFCVDNKLLEEALEQKRNELLQYLMIHLNNYKIKLQTFVSEHPIESKPYTTREKFTRMAEKNPTLLDLRESLDLELD
jgi:DNA polymerase III subunit gamma/tau